MFLRMQISQIILVLNVQFTHAIFELGVFQFEFGVFHFAICICAATFYFLFFLLISILTNENIWMFISTLEGNQIV